MEPNYGLQRIEFILAETKLKASELAKEIGIEPNKLYQIKRNQQGISKDIAQKINSWMPRYTEKWLMERCDIQSPPEDYTPNDDPLYIPEKITPSEFSEIRKLTIDILCGIATNGRGLMSIEPVFEYCLRNVMYLKEKESDIIMRYNDTRDI